MKVLKELKEETSDWCGDSGTPEWRETKLMILSWN